MSASERNFYKIDDVLLRVGTIGLLLVLLAGALGVLYAQGFADDESYPPNYARVLIGKHALAYLGLLACPLITLRLGWKFRRNERRIGALWKLLQRNAQVDVSDLLANSHFSTEDLERGVKLLNTRGLGHYVWDRAAGTIQDGRLRTMQLHVEKCETCGGSVSLAVPIAFTQVPNCPYCSGPVSVDTLEERRFEALQELREEHLPEKQTSQALGIPISIPTFGLLLVVFWPAALIYACYVYQTADQRGRTELP